MEEKNAQESTLKSKFFQIPIEDYEEDMERESCKEKKKEILELFTTYNKLRSKDEFDEIEDDLHDACRAGDLEMIKILLSEKIKKSREGLQFKIDTTNKTASLFKVNYGIEELIIPRTVEHNSTEYLITSIYRTCRNVKKIKFSEDSSVQTFYRKAFSWTKIEEIYFPASLKELKEGWCYRTNNLKKIIISPSNDQFKFEDDKYLISKSDSNNSNNDEFDTLLFVRRNIEEFSIPSNIKIISSCAFSNCENLTKVEIPENSNLQTIESNAFSWTNIESIYFPASLRELKKQWCFGTNKLKKIIISTSNGQFKFEDDKYLISKSDSNNDEFDTLLFVLCDIKEFSIPSNIKIISSYAFSRSKIETIFIPSKVTKICESAFYECENLIKVEIPTNSNLQTIESDAFHNTNIETIFIPSKVTKICEYAFYHCENLTKVEIPTNSNLQTIKKYAFYNTGIETIFIPSKVTKICENAFSNCQNLIKVKIPENSNLQTIESNAFSFSKIEEIYFPANLKELKEGWCLGTNNLKKIIISPMNDQFKFEDDKYLISKSDSNNTNNDEFDTLLFVRRDIKKFSIPSNIKIISSYAFSNCENLIKVEIPTNSNLQTIESNAFHNANIETIFIPSKVTKICEYAFYNCKNLIKVEIPENSNLQTIESFAFSCSKIETIFIPSKVIKICEEAFSYCKNLQIIEISEESKLESLSSTFEECERSIIMISSSLRQLININKPI